MSAGDVVIAAARRTPLGSLLGRLSGLSAPALGAAVIAAVAADAKVPGEDIDEVLMGCVLPAGAGQAPGRQAALQAGLPPSVGCTTINKVCGSGMKAVMLARDLIAAGSAGIVVAGGMESMSNAPYLLPRARRGLRMGHAELLDHMLYDGLQNAADGCLMGEFAERCVDRFGFSRAEQDAYAVESVKRAVTAGTGGAFDAEIVPLQAPAREGGGTVKADEEPLRCDISRIPALKPAFRRPDGTVTAASSASIADGAAALLLMRREEAERRGCAPLATIAGQATHSQAPAEFTTTPIGAVRKLLESTGWRAGEVDLYEINEAFAAVALAAIRELHLDPAKVNVHGGACALGHPIGATGARILVTLLHAMRARDAATGVAALCIGGGEATAVAVRR